MDLGWSILVFLGVLFLLMALNELWQRRKNSKRSKKQMQELKAKTSVVNTTPPPLPKKNNNTIVIKSDPINKQSVGRANRGNTANNQYVDDAAFLVSVNNITNQNNTPPPLPVPESKPYDGNGGKFGGGGASGSWDDVKETKGYTSNDHYKKDDYYSSPSYTSPSYSSSSSDSGSSSSDSGCSSSSSSSCD